MAHLIDELLRTRDQGVRHRCISHFVGDPILEEFQLMDSRADISIGERGASGIQVAEQTVLFARLEVRRLHSRNQLLDPIARIENDHRNGIARRGRAVGDDKGDGVSADWQRNRRIRLRAEGRAAGSLIPRVAETAIHV